jgi:hypothetical protein
MNGLLEAALRYAARGWAVFPVRPGGKTPITKHGLKDATTDPAIIRQWWEKWPSANIGIHCGASGLLAVDLDTKDGKDGLAEWRELARQHGFSENGTLASITPSGGRHLLYAMPGVRLGNSQSRLAPGVDTRGDGGYIVAPPSVVNGKPYRWEDDSVPILECPAPVVAALTCEDAPLHPWAAQRVTLADLLATDPPPTRWLVAGLLEAQSLVMVYGKAGSLKSMFTADLALCVAGGRDCLPPLPHQSDVTARAVSAAPVVWVNLDNSAPVTHRRFAALARGHGITDAPISIYNFPDLDLTFPASVAALRDVILAEGAGLVVVDTFINAANIRNENDNAELRVPMFALRQLIELTGATVILIHHPNKMSAANDSHDDLRGGSAIVGAVDAALRVVRADPKNDTITITATKCRNAPVAPLAALWTFERNAGGELAAGAFYGVPYESEAERANDELQARILAALAEGEMSVSAVQRETGGRKARIAETLRHLEVSGQIVSREGARNARLYSLAVSSTGYRLHT